MPYPDLSDRQTQGSVPGISAERATPAWVHFTFHDPMVPWLEARLTVNYPGYDLLAGGYPSAVPGGCAWGGDNTLPHRHVPYWAGKYGQLHRAGQPTPPCLEYLKSQCVKPVCHLSSHWGVLASLLSSNNPFLHMECTCTLEAETHTQRQDSLGYPLSRSTQGRPTPDSCQCHF